MIFGSLGTLTETSALHHKAFNETFAAEGLDWHWDDETYRRLLSHVGGTNRIVQYSREEPDRTTLSVEEATALHGKKTARYTELVRSSGLGLRPGVERLLREAAAAGTKLGLATGTSLENIQASLDATGGRISLADFDVHVTGDQIENAKPAPDAHRLCMERLAVEPADAVAIEDTFDGVASAVAAGARVIATPGEYVADHDFSAADIVVSDLGDPDHPATVLGGTLFDGPDQTDNDRSLSGGMVTMDWLTERF